MRDPRAARITHALGGPIQEEVWDFEGGVQSRRYANCEPQAGLSRTDETQADALKSMREPLPVSQTLACIAAGFFAFILGMAAVWILISLGRSN